MNWNYIIYGVVFLQFAAFAALVIALFKLKNGPILRYIQRGMKLAKLGSRIGISGLAVFGRNWMKGEELVEEVKGIAKGVQYGVRTDFGDRITYRSLLASWLSFQTTLGSVAAVLGFLKGLGKKKVVPPPGPQGASNRQVRLPRRSLADRMGLIPPAAKPLGRLFNYGRIAWEVRQELKRRGISPF